MDNEIINVTKDKYKKSISILKEDLASLKAGKANPKILDRIKVEYYGTLTPLNQMANISAPEPRLLLIQPYDKSCIKQIEKAILMSDLGLNPSNDGNSIRLVIPELTEETRKKLVKSIKKMSEETKIAIRNSRREANEKIKKLEKAGEITEDDRRQLEKAIQNETDEAVKIVDKLIEQKSNELMSI